MQDAERIESAHNRTYKPRNSSEDIQWKNDIDEPTPMDIGNVRTKKLTAAERAMCMKEGRCFICREKGHLASDCPKVQGN